MRRTANAKNKYPINIVGSSTFGIYNKISSARTINMFITDNWLTNTAGYERVLTLSPDSSGEEGRDVFNSIRGGFLLVVVGASVYRVDANFQVTLIGTLNTSVGEVFIDENLSAQICIVDGLNAYIYNYDTGPFLTVQALSGSLVPGYVEYHNSYFLFGNANVTSVGSAWYAYQFDTPTTIVQATNGQFALQTKPDYALAVVRLPGQGNNVLVFGRTVAEIWTQVGGTEIYRRNSTVNIDYGCASISTISRSDKYVAWLGVNENNAPVIMVYTGQSFGPISTDGIDHQMSLIKFPSQSTASFFRMGGHLFYQLTFYNPVDNFTLIYDFNTEKFYDFTDANLDHHPARNYALFNNATYFISLNNASLYKTSIDLTTYNEVNLGNDPANLEIPRIRICDTISEPDSAQFRATSLGFIIEQGNDPAVTGVSLGNNLDLLITENNQSPFPNSIIYTEQGTAMVDEDSDAGIGGGILPPPYRPRVDLAISRDGGITFGSYVGRGLNPVAIRQNILTWESMGMCNYFTPMFRFWGMSRFVASNGFLETT